MHNHVVVDNLSTTLTALSDPTRRAILARLAQGPAVVSELVEPFNMTQQAISKHLACLERAQLIVKRREGRQSVCTLNPAPFGEVTGWIAHCQQEWEARFSRLDTVLETLKQQEAHHE